MENSASADSHPGESPSVSPGSTLDRGMSVENRTTDRSEEGGTLNSGGPEFIPEETIHLHGASRSRPKEDAAGQRRESDLPIVVGDGKTDNRPPHLQGAVDMAKGQAQRQ